MNRPIIRRLLLGSSVVTMLGLALLPTLAPGAGAEDPPEVLKSVPLEPAGALLDSDGDGLTDGDEVGYYFTNPALVDTDGDVLVDGYEVAVTGTNPLIYDTDGDTLDDGYEVLISGTNPFKGDTDDDTLSDLYELAHGTNPLNSDTDQDTIGDAYDSDPLHWNPRL